MVATQEPGSVVKTLGLGSCVAVVFLDPLHRLVGLVHVALPDSGIDPKKALDQPGYFADTGIQSLYRMFRDRGYRAESKTLRVLLIGGSQVLESNEGFNIGKRNILACKKVLGAMGLVAMEEELGGDISRSVKVESDTGTVVISSPGLPDKIIVWRSGSAS